MPIKGPLYDRFLVKIVFLGTSAAVPTAQRSFPCICIQRDGEILMFDAGEGSQMTYRAAGLGWNKKMSIFVSHLHGDHCLGLLGMIQTMSLQDRDKRLFIYGPLGTEEFVRSNMRMLGTTPRFEVAVQDVTEGIICNTNSYAVHGCAAKHSIPTLSYLFKEHAKAGRFNVQRAHELGVPEGALWGQLQRGNSVCVSGVQVTPGQVLGPSRPGISIGYSGDSRPSPELEEFFTRCNYLIFDSTFTTDMIQRAIVTGHSTSAQAATLAKNAQVQNLILTHFSARYQDADIHLKEARRIHDSVIAAQDMLVIDVYKDGSCDTSSV